VIVNGYWLQGTELQCRSWQLGAPDTGDGVVMAANVLDFKVYFGFDMNAYNGTAAIDAPPVSTAVLTATDIDAMPALGNVSAWEFVVAVHLCLQNFSEEAGVTVASDSGMAPACPSTAAEFSTGQTPLRAIPNAAPPGAIVRVHQQSFTIRTAAAGLP
jgi:hypothetical protein